MCFISAKIQQKVSSGRGFHLSCDESAREMIKDLGESILTEYMYEGMFLVDSNRYAADPEGTQQAVLGMLERVGAKVVASRPWQEGKLCYPIEGQRKGLYYLACFTMDGGSMTELNRLSKLNDAVMRQLVLRHPKVIFDAMVDALTQHDGAIHSPEQKADRESRSDRPVEAEEGGEEI
jgi:small subunit ribosomal protein S6